MPKNMSTPLQQALSQTRDDILRHWRSLLDAAGGAHTRGLVPQTELNTEMRTLLDELIATLDDDGDGDGAAFASDNSHPLAHSLRAAGLVRASRGYSPEESLHYLQACKDALQHTAAEVMKDPASAQAASSRISKLMDRCVVVLAGSFIQARETIMVRQTEALREVSTPVIALWDSMLLLPLVGIVDSVRAQTISERLLQAISDSEAEVTLIDVTGVPVMDTSVARHLLKTITAAEMLGTRVILTGISPSTAQTMVKLGIDMSSVPTRATLKSGVALAMTMTRRRVIELDASSDAVL